MTGKLRLDSVLYEFDCFRVDPVQRVLTRGDQLIPLTPKAFELLLALVESEGRLVEKDELLKRVWPDTFVEEGSLAQNISVLRKTLSETGGGQYIQTIARRGYRFVAPVKLQEAAPEFRPTRALSKGNLGDSTEARPGSRVPYYLRRRYMFSAAAIVVAIAAAMLWERTRPSPLTDQDVLVLADFTNLTGDTTLDGTLRDALAFQLEQSPFLKVLDDEIVRQDLLLMRRPPQEHVTNDLAHDICVREGEKAILGGSIASLGKSYAIELKATNCQTGAIIVRQEAQAADKEHVLAALGKAAQGIRAKLGESLASIEKLAPPEFQVTTSSLEAFQAFDAGQRLFLDSRFAAAVPLFQRATELDPTFAMAYKYLSSALLNTGCSSSEVIQENADKAYALRDRVSAYQRF
jgi:DNA-binding winged helix-turn-helix (wHTH) protein